MAVIRLTTGKPGDGKTWSIVRRICKERIPDKQVGTLWTNLPLKLDELAAYAARKHNIPEEELRAKIRIIPQDEIERWRKGTSNPAFYFEHIADVEEWETSPLDKSEVIIDEAGKIWPSNSRKTADEKRAIDAVAEWLATIRHEGATIELICQDSRQIDRKLVQMVGEHFVMNNTAEEKEPIGGCRKGDWYQLWSGLFLRESITWIRCTRSLPSGEKLEQVETFTHWLDPEYFSYYDSYNKPGAQSGTRKLQPWERMNAVVLLGWFALNNLPNLAVRLAGVAFVAWLCFFGGGGWCVEYLNSQINLGLGRKPALRSDGGGGAATPQVVSRSQGGPSAQDSEISREGLLAQTRQLVKDLRAQQERVLQLEAELAAKETSITDASAIVSITSNGFSFTNGDYYAKDETIGWGPYAGDRAVVLDPARRLVRLHSGRILRMQDARAVPFIAQLDTNGERPRPAAGEPTPAEPRGAGDDGSNRPTGDRVGLLDLPGHSVLDRSGSETRPTAGDPYR